MRPSTWSHDDETLRESQERYRLVVENATDLITLIEADGTIAYASPSHEPTLGFAPAQLVGRNVAELLHPDDLAHIVAEMRVTLSGVAREAVARLRRADGEYVSVEGIASPIRDETGAVRRIVTCCRDIGERLRAAELEERLERARQLEMVGRLAGGIAHDFNNLLTAMNGYGDVALRRLRERGDDPQLVEWIEEMRSAGDKAATLTGQLLAFSRRQVLQPTVVDLNDVVREYEPILTRVLGDDVTVAVALDDGLGAVLADESQLGQVIVNLAVNARDAMPGGGRLTISTRNVTLEEGAALPDVEPGPYVVLAVEDTGTGIAPDILERIFEPFFTTKGPGEGTGLGLATVLGVVQQSGGSVSAYSEPDQGSVFNVYLPRTDAEPARRHAEPEPEPRPDRRGERVLLVEDNAAVRGLVHDVLGDAGYDVLDAACPREALELVATETECIDLLLTDVVMPEMNGRELADRLRETRPQLRVLYASGYTDDAMISRGVLAPGMAFLQKPFSVAELERKVREVLDTAA